MLQRNLISCGRRGRSGEEMEKTEVVEEVMKTKDCSTFGEFGGRPVFDIYGMRFRTDLTLLSECVLEDPISEFGWWMFMIYVRGSGFVGGDLDD